MMSQYHSSIGQNTLKYKRRSFRVAHSRTRQEAFNSVVTYALLSPRPLAKWITRGCERHPNGNRPGSAPAAAHFSLPESSSKYVRFEPVQDAILRVSLVVGREIAIQAAESLIRLDSYPLRIRQIDRILHVRSKALSCLDG